MEDWTPLDVRRPTEADADKYGCVMIYDQLNGVKITGWRNECELRRQFVTHWAPTPRGPLKVDLCRSGTYHAGICDDGRVGYYLPAGGGAHGN